MSVHVGDGVEEAYADALRRGPGFNAKLRDAIDRSLGQPLLIDEEVMPR